MNAKTTSLVANLYNPHEQSKEQLINSFTLRHNVFHELFQEIKSSDMTKPERHYLIEGQRGMGKTTLLLRLSYEIENDRDLRNWLIPIVLKEEAYYGIRHLFKLWEAVAQELEAKDQAFSGLARQMRAAYSGNGASISSCSTEESYEQICFTILMQALKNHEKKIILCIDNLGEMLQNFSDQENHRLREVLTSCPYLRLIGATAVVFEALPKKFLVSVFHNVFTTMQLEGLDKEETQNLLWQLAKTSHQESPIRKIIEQHPGRIEALRILTGGVIRTIILLFEVFTGNQNGTIMTDLDEILDRITPLYQSRMKELTPLQRELVNAIALNWDAVSPEEIAQETYLDPGEVLAVLGDLEKVSIVQCLITDTQQRFYGLQDRFFNIWYLMRLAPGGSQSKVLWLLHFLESWYEKDELIQQARNHTKVIAARHDAPRSAYYLTEALVKTGQLDRETEHRMIRKTKELLWEFDTNLAAEISLSDKEILNEAEKSYQNEDYEKATSLFLKIRQKNGQIYFRLGDSFRQLADYQEAIHYFVKAVEQEHVDAMFHLASLYHYTLKEYQHAETYYIMAVKRGNLHAMLSLGHLFYYKVKDYQKAEKYYLMAETEGRKRVRILTSGKFSLNALKNYLISSIKGEVDNPEQYHLKDVSGVKEQYVDEIKSLSTEAMFQLGNLYGQELKDYEKAQMYYVAAIKAGSTNAITHLGILYHYMLRDYRKAIKYYTLAIKKGDRSYAAVNLGALYQHEMKDYKNAQKYYLLAVEKDTAGAMNGLAWLYFEQRLHKQEALRYAKQAFESEQNLYTAHTLACISLWNNQPEDAIQIAQEFMYNKESYSSISQDIILYLMLLLAKKQYHYLADYFETPELNLRERFKPLYYAFLYYTHEPNYYKRPPELVEPIKGVIGQITRLAINYA